MIQVVAQRGHLWPTHRRNFGPSQASLPKRALPIPQTRARPDLAFSLHNEQSKRTPFRCVKYIVTPGRLGPSRAIPAEVPAAPGAVANSFWARSDGVAVAS